MIEVMEQNHLYSVALDHRSGLGLSLEELIPAVMDRGRKRDGGVAWEVGEKQVNGG